MKTHKILIVKDLHHSSFIITKNHFHPFWLLNRRIKKEFQMDRRFDPLSIGQHNCMPVECGLGVQNRR